MNNPILKIKSSVLSKMLPMLALPMLLGMLFVPVPGAQASDIPTATYSPLAGIDFDDQPLILPVQRNFQMAMLTASSELGRSCGKIESYGWRLEGQEQQRVNQIFNNTVDRIRAQGFAVEVKQTKGVSSDVTLFTADNRDKNLLFLWSAGDIGLVMVLCETSSPLKATRTKHTARQDQPTAFPMPRTIAPQASLSSRIAAGAGRQPRQLTRTGKIRYEDFTPKGRWVGSYNCSHGTMGATFDMQSLKGDHFEGTFRFYPTAKNPYVAKGKYKVFGEYDAESQRILLNPGKWIDRPKGYHNTIMIGSFDPVKNSFSAFFQGITGCTSFEARHRSGSDQSETKVKKPKKKKKIIKKKRKKTIVKKKAKKPPKAKTVKAKKVKKPAAKKIVKKAVPKPAPKKVPAPVPSPVTAASTSPVPPPPPPPPVHPAPAKAAPAKIAPVKLIVPAPKAPGKKPSEILAPTATLNLAPGGIVLQ